jgi:hypothetical protein
MMAISMSRDPAMPKVERWLLLVDALGWTGTLELQIYGGKCNRIMPYPDLPLETPDFINGTLSEQQQAMIGRIEQYLAKLPGEYAGRLFIPIEDGNPGEPRVRPEDYVYPAGQGKR